MRTTLIAVLTAMLMLTACGQTGPLYLPGGSPSAQVEEENENGEEGNSEESGQQQQVQGATE